MPCIVPFTNSNLDTSFLVFRPVGVFGEDLVEALKCFSYRAEDHGCTYSSVFKSLHGNMVIWYGAWMKRSDEKKKLLNSSLTSVATSLSSMGVLLECGFFEVYGGESKDGRPAAKFSSGDIVSITSTLPVSNSVSKLSYAYLALQKSWFLRIEGLSAGVCLRSYENPTVASLHVWKSLHSYYSWLLNSSYRENILPYIDHLSFDSKYDVFQVIYVNNEDTVTLRLFPSPKGAENQYGSKEKRGLESSKDSNVKL